MKPTEAAAAAAGPRPGSTGDATTVTGCAEAEAPVAHSFSVPGLTITSFHLQQLQASKQVGRAVYCVNS
jgi:hypothetical protein